MATIDAPSNRESHFTLEELFFSTTDRKGFITFGNDVFVRVSHYEASELMGQPHNVIRHPDMPHCIFRLLWDYLRQGKPMAAYVKNMAKDRSFYWVLAFVAPIPGGYLSIRLKPSSPFFDRVRKIYEELHAVEQQADDAGLSRIKSMDAAGERLQAILKAHGFPDYDRFMNEILAAEVLSRKAMLKRSETPAAHISDARDDLTRRRRQCAQLGEHIQRLNGTLQSFMELEKSFTDTMQFAFTFGRTLHRLTLNGQILATTLGGQGNALREVAREMNAVSAEVATVGQRLGQTMGEVMACLKRAAAEISASDLSVEMMSLFLAELQADGGNGPSMTHNLDNLSAVIADRFRSTCQCTEQAARDLSAFEKIVDHFMNTVQTLDILYVSGRIESVRQSGATEFGEVLGELVTAVADARQRSGQLGSIVTRVQAQLLKESANQRQFAMSFG